MCSSGSGLHEPVGAGDSLRAVTLRDRFAAIRGFHAGEFGPPAESAKRRHLLHLLRTQELRVFLESGTYLGETLAWMLPHVERAVSVELDPALYEAATRRFAGEPKVDLRHGDARLLIPKLIDQFEEPALVWLDGHFSGEGTARGVELEPAPTILETLAHVSVVPGTVIVVDDLRLFGRLEGFPPLERLISCATAGLPDAELMVGLDSLVVLV
jgi:hypothetical protein